MSNWWSLAQLDLPNLFEFLLIKFPARLGSSWALIIPGLWLALLIIETIYTNILLFFKYM